MDPVIISTLITAGFSLLGTFAGIMVSSKLTTYRIEQLEKKVEEHNNLIERVYKLEKKDELIDLTLKNMQEKVSDLGKKING